MWNWFYLANPPIMIFAGGGGLDPGIILYTSHFLSDFTLHVLASFILETPSEV